MSFEIIQMTSFWSVWYWIVMVVAWSMTAHWTLGVPYDLILAARRGDEVFSEHCDTVTYINAYRTMYYVDKAGPWIIGFMSFSLAIIGTLGFVSGYEFAQAMFMLLGPISVPMLFSVRLAYRIDREQATGEALRKILLRRRLWNQLTGFLAIVLTMAVAIYNHLESKGLLDPSRY